MADKDRKALQEHYATELNPVTRAEFDALKTRLDEFENQYETTLFGERYPSHQGWIQQLTDRLEAAEEMIGSSGVVEDPNLPTRLTALESQVAESTPFYKTGDYISYSGLVTDPDAHSHQTLQGHPFTDNGEGKCARCLDKASVTYGTKLEPQGSGVSLSGVSIEPNQITGGRVDISDTGRLVIHGPVSFGFAENTPRIQITPEQLRDLMACSQTARDNGWLDQSYYHDLAVRINEFFNGGK